MARFLFVFELLRSEGRGLVSSASRPAAWLQPPAFIVMPGSPDARTAPQTSRPLFEADPGEVFIELLYQARDLRRSVLIAALVKKLCLVFRICLTCFSQTLRTPVLRPLPRAKLRFEQDGSSSTNHDFEFESYRWPRLSRRKRSARVSSRRVARLSGLWRARCAGCAVQEMPSVWRQKPSRRRCARPSGLPRSRRHRPRPQHQKAYNRPNINLSSCALHGRRKTSTKHANFAETPCFASQDQAAREAIAKAVEAN